MQAGVKVDVPTRAEWERVWEACEHATFFQSPTWAEIWQAASGGVIRARPQRLTFADGCQAILPLCHERRLFGLLDRQVASPHATFGGWLSEHPLQLPHAHALLDRLLDERSSLVWRMNPYDALALSAGAERALPCKADVTHALELSPGPQALLRNFRNGYGRNIQRARRDGRIAVEAATSIDEWRAYFRVYQETLARWGLSPAAGYPWRVFEVMAELASPHVTLWIARMDGVIVSGELCMYARRHAVSWHAATLSSHLRTHVAKAQIFHVIEDACRRGCRWFDFNPSAGLCGVREFKESFGAQPLPAPIVYVDTQVKRWARRLAKRVGVPYAAPELTPLSSVLAQTREVRTESGRANGAPRPARLEQAAPSATPPPGWGEGSAWSRRDSAPPSRPALAHPGE